MYVLSCLWVLLITVCQVPCQSETGQNENVYLNLMQNAHRLAHTQFEIPELQILKGGSSRWADNIGNWNRFYRASETNSNSKTDGQTLGQSFTSSLLSANVSQKCSNQTAEYIVDLILDFKTKWVQQMADAAGKPGSGLLQGNMIWLGSITECKGVRAEIYYNNNHTAKSKPDDTFGGRYCLAVIPLKPSPPGAMYVFIGIKLGVCVPDSCSGDDVTNILNNVLDDLVNITGSNLTKGIRVLNTECHLEDRQLDTKATVVFVISMLFVAVMVIGTFIDIMFVQIPMRGRLSVETEDGDIISHLKDGGDEHTPLLEANKQHAGPSCCVKVFLAFSIYTNAKKLLDTSRPKGTLTAVHGIRFISMTWVILGHVVIFSMGVVDNLVSFVEEIKRFSLQCVINATVSVDTFFTLSGLLVTYLTLKEMKKHKKGLKFNWLMFYFHRFWRLTPPYMLILMVYTTLMPYIGTGPAWPQSGFEMNQCKDTWWTNLLYINNLVKQKEMCMGWSWYLSNDMQFYVLSPLLLIPFFYCRIPGIIVSMVFLLTTLITTGVISRVEHLVVSLGEGASSLQNMTTTDTNKDMDSLNDIYMVPWCRMGPYIIGIMTGYILYKSECRVRLSKVTVVLGWAIATASALAVVYGLYDVNNGHPVTNDVAAFYNSVNRTVWGACICWVVFACATGYGGFVNTLLSWKGIIPLSRLTYCAYLLHPIIMYYYYYNLETPFHLTDINLTFMFCSFLVASYAVSFIVSLAFEAPMMNLEKIFLKRDKNS